MKKYNYNKIQKREKMSEMLTEKDKINDIDIDSLEQNTLESKKSLTQDNEKIGYMDVSAERKIQIDESVANNFGRVCDKTRKKLDMLMIDAISSGADVDTRIWLTALKSKYQDMVSEGRNALARGDYDVLLDEKGLENLERIAQQDVAAAEAVVKRQQTLDEARKDQESKEKELREKSAMASVKTALESSEETVENKVEQIDIPKNDKVEQGTEEDEPTRDKLGFFERRNKQDAVRVYGAVDNLIERASKAEHLSEEQRARLEASAKSYRDAYDRILSGDYIPKRESIKNSEDFLEELKDIIIVDKKSFGEPLSKDEQKRYKKLKK